MPKIECDKILSCLDNLRPLAQVVLDMRNWKLSGLILLKKKESNVSLKSFPHFFLFFWRYVIHQKNALHLDERNKKRNI